MAWWISAALSSKGIPVGQPAYQSMIRELVAQTYAAGGWLAVEINSPMQEIMIKHGPKVTRPPYPPAAQNAQGMPLGPNSVPPQPRHPAPVMMAQAPQTMQTPHAPGAPLPVQNNPGLIENRPGRIVPVDAPVFQEPSSGNGDQPFSMTDSLEPSIEY